MKTKEASLLIFEKKGLRTLDVRVLCRKELYTTRFDKSTMRYDRDVASKTRESANAGSITCPWPGKLSKRERVFPSLSESRAAREVQSRLRVQATKRVRSLASECTLAEHSEASRAAIFKCAGIIALTTRECEVFV
jgi:hypothetical protein